MTYIDRLKLDPAQFSVDAGSRVRVSQMTTLGAYKTLNFDKVRLWDNVGTGTGTFISNKYNMSVTSGQYRVRQTKRFHPYLEGKSTVMEFTFDNYHKEANVTKRFGYYSSSSTGTYSTAYDGFYIENDGNDYYLKVDRNGTNVLSKAMSTWDGYSQLGGYQTGTVWQNFTVVAFDFLWLGGATLRVWIKTNNGFVLAHTYNYAGTSQDVFIGSPQQPLRYEIRSSTGSGSFRPICCQISTEGAIEESGQVGNYDTGNTLITLATAGTTYPLKAIKKNSNYRDIAIKIEELNLMVGTTSDQVRWSLQINPTLSAPLTYSSGTSSAVMHANGNGTITVTTPGYEVIGKAFTSTSSESSHALDANSLSWLGGTIDNTMEEYVLCATPLTAHVSLYGGFVTKEFG